MTRTDESAKRVPRIAAPVVGAIAMVAALHVVLYYLAPPPGSAINILYGLLIGAVGIGVMVVVDRVR